MLFKKLSTATCMEEDVPEDVGEGFMASTSFTSIDVSFSMKELPLSLVRACTKAVCRPFADTSRDGT